MEWDACEEFIGAMRTSGHYADQLRARAKTDDLHLFWVVNTAGKKQFIIAKEFKLARILSERSGHIRATSNGQIFKAASRFFDNNPGFGSAVRRAMKDRIPGVIERKGEHGIMGEKVYSPLSAI